MVKLIRLNDKEFALNPDLIEVIEFTPDTIITLTNGHKYIVRNSVDEVIQKIIEYRKQTVSQVTVIEKALKPLNERISGEVRNF